MDKQNLKVAKGPSDDEEPERSKRGCRGEAQEQGMSSSPKRDNENA